MAKVRKFVKRRPKKKSKKHFSQQYLRYLRSPEWRAFRELVFEYYGRRCMRCRYRKRLQVHHLHYRTLGCESLEDVKVLCFWCHEAEHEGK